MLELTAHHAMGYTRLYRGELTLANEHGSRGLALYDPDREREILALYQLSSTVCCASFLGDSDLMLGYPDRAERNIQRMLAVANELGHLPSKASAMGFACFFYHFALNPQRTREIADELFVLSNEQGFQNWVAMSFIYRAWTRTRMGEIDQGIAEMQYGIPMFRAIGAKLTLIGVYAQLAEALVSAGRIDDALEVVRDGIAEANERLEHLCEPELYRFRAEALLKRDPPDREGAESAYRDAARVASSQGARLLELRAYTGLAKLLVANDRAAEARDLLGPCLAWFTEGFGTNDLRDARSALEAANGGLSTFP